MKHARLFSVLVSAASAVTASGPALAADQQREQVQAQTQQSERIYGSELMTPQERNAYQARMRTTKTEEERSQLRKEHHEQMKERARQRGITLPDEPPLEGRGQGPAYGNPPGAGPGPSAGPGPGAGSKGR